MTRRSLDDWLAFISSQHPAAIALGLERVREVWERMARAPSASGARGVGEGPVTITVGGICSE